MFKVKRTPRERGPSPTDATTNYRKGTALLRELRDLVRAGDGNADIRAVLALFETEDEQTNAMANAGAALIAVLVGAIEEDTGETSALSAQILNRAINVGDRVGFACP